MKILNRFLVALILISAYLCLPAMADDSHGVAASSPTTVHLAVPTNTALPIYVYDRGQATGDSVDNIPNCQAMAAV